MARKGENIFKRKDGRWEARYIFSRDKAGKAQYKSVYAKSYLDVKTKRQICISSFTEKNCMEQNQIARTVTEFGREWLANNAHKWKESTLCRYREKLNIYILPEFGDRAFSEISTEEVEHFLTRIQSEGISGKKPVSQKTAGMILSVFKQLRLYALKMDCPVRFAPECIIIKKAKNRITIFTVREEKILIAALKDEMNETKAGILLCLFTGIRIGELCALKCDDINLADRTLHIGSTMQRLPVSEGNERTHVIESLPKSSSSVRDIPLDKDLIEMIRRFHKPGAFFLTGDTDKYVEPRTMQNRFAKILEKCGLSYRKFHTTRHTFATRCIERGIDVKTLSEILGHASVSTTMDQYVHLSMEHKAESVGLLSDLFVV